MNYLISFMYKQSRFYSIWVSDDEDYVVTKEGQILFFDTIELLEQYEKDNRIKVNKNEEIQYNLDKMLIWCLGKDEYECGCEEILNLWNISHDVANSVNKYFLGDESVYDELYEKVFYANDLFSSNPAPHDSVSEFSENEVLNIRKILKNGIEIIIEGILEKYSI